MRVVIPRKCPYCSESFQPRRRNQLYCSSECRTDANNELAKSQYARFKEGAPKVDAVKSELKKLKEYIASLTIVLQGVEEIDKETIIHAGCKYKRGTKIAQPKIGITIGSRGAILLPGNKIIYRIGSSTSGSCWEYYKV